MKNCYLKKETSFFKSFFSFPTTFLYTSPAPKIKAFSFLFAGLSLSYLFYQLAYASEREHKIFAKAYKKHGNYYVKEMDEFVDLGPTEHGTLNGRVMKHIRTGEEFIKKGAHSKEDMQKEFLISFFLHQIYPDYQPAAYILQERINHSQKARFYSLSHKQKNSMDLESFICQPDWKQKLKNKGLQGFDVSLAIDSLLGKQQDSKYANYIVRELSDQYRVATIDHEMAKASKGWSQPRKSFSSLKPSDHTNMVHDLFPPSEDNRAGLAGDERATEFMEEAKKNMRAEHLLNFYQKLSKTSLKPLFKVCQGLAKESNLFSDSGCKKWENLLSELKNKAKDISSKQEFSKDQEGPSQARI